MLATISMEELYSKYENLGADELILDVRTPEEYQEGHVPGSRNITHTEVAAHAKELSKFKKVYVYCRSGGRVQMCTYELVNLGLNNLVAVVNGGMPNWIASGHPVEK